VAELAPGRVPAQVQRICLAGQAGVAGQEASQRQLLLVGEYRSGTAIAVDGDEVVVVIGHLPGRAETLEAGPAEAPATMIHLTVNPYIWSRKVIAVFETVDP
jgi:hypothetical protein